MISLTAENVNRIFLECLFKEEEIAINVEDRVYVEAHGIMTHVGFHPGRIKEHEQEIEWMLLQLPKEFLKSVGGGWSFLNACEDVQGNQWTGLHKTMDELVCLGLATKKVMFLTPREMWAMFPGGMPYFVVLNKE